MVAERENYWPSWITDHQNNVNGSRWCAFVRLLRVILWIKLSSFLAVRHPQAGTGSSVTALR